MLNSRRIGLTWIEQRDFLYDCILAYLKTNLLYENDPMALALQYMVFKGVADERAQTKTQQKLYDYLEALADIHDSGFQARDCLVVSLCAKIFDWPKSDPTKFNKLALPRIEYAASANWFDNPELASTVSSISNKLPACELAGRYLVDKIDEWIQRNYVSGIIHYILACEPQEKTKVYLEKIDWVSQNITLQSWGLLTFQQLGEAGYETKTLQKNLSEHLYIQLRSSQIFEKMLYSLVGQQHEGKVLSDDYTSYELSLALYALYKTGYDVITGVNRDQKEELENLIKSMSVFEKGGTYISNRRLLFYEITVFVCLLFVLYEVMQFVDTPGIGPVAGALVEFFVQLVVIIVGVFLLRKTHPTQTISAEIFSTDDENAK